MTEETQLSRDDIINMLKMVSVIMAYEYPILMAYAKYKSQQIIIDESKEMDEKWK